MWMGHSVGKNPGPRNRQSQAAAPRAAPAARRRSCMMAAMSHWNFMTAILVVAGFARSFGWLDGGARMEFTGIDGETRPRLYQPELRQADLYFHLAQGHQG